jgi:hypothetical protein
MDKDYQEPTKKPNTTETQTPHSGTLEGSMRDTPSTNFDNTDLKDFADIQLDNIPHSAATLPDNMPPIDNVVGTEVAEPPVNTPPTGPDTHSEGAPNKNKFVRNAIIGGAAAAAIVGGIVFGSKVAADNNNKENAPPAPDPKATSETTPTQTTAPETVATPAPQETSVTTPEVEASNITIDYSLFENWDSKTEPVNPNDNYSRSETKEYAAEQTFVANGLAPIERREVMALWTGEQITDFVIPRINFIYQLYRDGSNPQNKAIAKDLLEIMTSQRVDTSVSASGDAYTILSRRFDTGTTDSTPFIGDLGNITRETSGTAWSNGEYNEYSIEYEGKDAFGDTAYPTLTYEWTKKNDFRLVAIYNVSAGDDYPVTFGRQAPEVLDPSRAGASYNLG